MTRDSQRENSEAEYNETTARDNGAEEYSGGAGSIDDVYAGEDFSLESILAEYKGTAYIDGDKKTPPSVLQEKTNQILMEVIGTTDGRPRRSTESPIENETPVFTERTAQQPKLSEKTGPLPKLSERTGPKPKIQPDSSQAPENSDATKRLPKADELIKAQSADIKKKIEKISTDSKKKDRDVIIFEELKPNGSAEQGSIIAEVEKAIEKQTQIEEDTQKAVRKASGIFRRGGGQTLENEVAYETDEYEEPSPIVIEEEVFEEPDFRAAAKRFAEGCNTYSMRSFICLLISIVMAILTFVFQAGAKLPFGIGNNKILFNGILLILLFVVMGVSIDKIIYGLVGFFRKGPGIESLNLMSCIATAAAAGYNIVAQDTSTGMPYCVISAFTMTFTLWGEKIYYKALTETTKTAMSVSNPVGVVAEMNRDLDKTIIKKASGRTSGFYNNLIQADIVETIYKYAAPIFIVAAIVLGFYASFGHDLKHHILHNIAAVMAAAAPFSAMMSFAIPFAAVAKRARISGAAIAGWGGADDIYHSDGASITDEDLFPAGTVSLGGIKIFEEVSPEKALRYTASLIIASNCGLTKLFSEHLSKQGMSLIRVEDFSCYEGGIGGTIKGERVISGSAAFMNLMGIRVPASLNVKNAIFTAVNKKLIAVFTVNYVPIKSVHNALFSVMRYHVKLFFAMRDFSITPVMLEQKFKVPVDAVEYIPIQESYEISDSSKHEAKRVSAILTREGLGPFVEAITAGRRLRMTALVATVFSLASAALGMLLMFIICWSGAYTSASAGNLLLYMLTMLAIVLLISGFARFRQ